MRGLLAIATLIIFSCQSSAQQSAQQTGGTKVGGLACESGMTIGLVLGSQQQLNCVFQPSGGGPVESYQGTLQRIGVDLGFTSASKLVWGVFAPTGNLGPRALAGTYVGGSGGASFAVGGEAHVLFGGSNNTVSLQPLSFEGQTGVNVALGVANLTLR